MDVPPIVDDTSGGAHWYRVWDFVQTNSLPFFPRRRLGRIYSGLRSGKKISFYTILIGSHQTIFDLMDDSEYLGVHVCFGRQSSLNFPRSKICSLYGRRSWGSQQLHDEVWIFGVGQLFVSCLPLFPCPLC